MITEDYVTFDTAKLLKEKGFDVPCEHYYAKEVLFGKDYIHLLYTDEPLHNSEIKGENINFLAWECTAPTLQIAMKWLREVHDIYIMIDKDFATEKGWHYVVVRKQDWVNNIDNGLTQQESNSYTYEFACEAAIKYCLENLI